MAPSRGSPLPDVASALPPCGGLATCGGGGAGAQRRPADGLVHSSETSQTRGVERLSGLQEITFSTAHMRVARLRRTVPAVGRAIQEVALAGGVRTRPWLLTLTYRPGVEWAPKHVSGLLDCLRKWGLRQRISIPYLWVAEMQNRGAVHYHIILWLPVRLTLPKPDKQGWWPYGMTNTKRANKPINYAMKYASKGDGVAFPRGLRLSGYGGLTAPGRAIRYWLCLPRWIHARLRSGYQRITRLPGGLWLLEETGELWRSAWQFVRLNKDATMTFRKREAVCAM